MNNEVDAALKKSLKDLVDWQRRYISNGWEVYHRLICAIFLWKFCLCSGRHHLQPHRILETGEYPWILELYNSRLFLRLPLRSSVKLTLGKTKLSRSMFTCLQRGVSLSPSVSNKKVLGSIFGQRTRVWAPLGPRVPAFCPQIRLYEFYFQPCFRNKCCQHTVMGETRFRKGRDHQRSGKIERLYKGCRCISDMTQDGAKRI
jgi:hypothetical protein